MRIASYIIPIIFLLSCGPATQKPTEPKEIEWRSFNAETFKIASDENKLVFLEVGANWCHWCHVMDDSTYTNPDVQVYLHDNFILCREDQDARPDLFAAYKPWGWPALIVFNQKGEELLKLKGYHSPKRFLAKLKEVVSNPIPIASDGTNGNQSTSISATDQVLIKEFEDKLDYEQGGFPWNNKSLDLNGLMHALKYAPGNKKLENWLDLTVNQSYLLVDTVWSGVYQYSAKRSWDNQHYEKLLRYQASYIESYCRYGAVQKDPLTIAKAEEILGYCKRFLKGDGPLYWNSQNADLVSGEHSGEYYALDEKSRLLEGVPSVDKKIYLKENSALICAHIWLWAATDKKQYLEEGQKMLDHILAEYGNEQGIYSRELGQSKILSFEDNRQLLEALILYAQVTSNSVYIEKAEKLADACIKNFNSPEGIKSVIGDVAFTAPIVEMDNLLAVLTFNKLSYLCHNERYKEFALSTFSNLDQKQLRTSLATLPLLIRARQELDQEPFQAKFISDNPKSKEKMTYLRKILLARNPYFIFQEIEIGKMPKEDELLYGSFKHGTLFMCTSSFCSAPIQNEEALIQFLTEQE